MAFMVPVAEYLTAEEATEFIAESECADELVPQEAGWYGRLSAPGYLDATEWQGPYLTEDMAVQAVCEMYEVDADGEPLEV